MLERTFHLAALLLALLCAACATTQNPRKAEIASVFVSADARLFRDRPRLVEGKYARMAKDPYVFFRGAVPLFQHDWEKNNFNVRTSKFYVDKPFLSFGDAHPENFGTLLERDGKRFLLAPNDFDNLGSKPYLWDVRRLAVGMALAARLSNDKPNIAIQASRAVAEGYAHGVEMSVIMYHQFRIRDGSKNPILEDLFDRSTKELLSTNNLDALSGLEGKTRRVRRGAIESDRVLVDLPKAALEPLPAAISRYRESLVEPPPAEFFTLLDAAREIGSGVGSFPRVRVVLLVRGPTDDPSDDVVLELKEVSEASPIEERRTYVRAMFYTVVAPLWGFTEWMGLTCQIRLDSSAQKTIRVSRFKKERGTPEALTDLAGRLGGALSNAHSDAQMNDEMFMTGIRDVIAKDPAAFADEQAAIANAYASQVLVDFELFREALKDLGPSLGAERGPGDPSMSQDLRALIADDLVPPP